MQLFDADPDSSYAAADALWNLVAHQGIVGSVSIPTLPFLIERIETHPPINVLQELSEILYSFSYRLEPPDTSKWSQSDWEVQRRNSIIPMIINGLTHYATKCANTGKFSVTSLNIPMKTSQDTQK